MMPTIYREGPYKFFFYANERNEPVHIHVESGMGQAKFWLDPIALASAAGYASPELTKIQRIVEAHRDEFIAKWNEFHRP